MSKKKEDEITINDAGAKLKSIIILIIVYAIIYSVSFVDLYVDKFNTNQHCITFLFSFVLSFIWIGIWLFKIYPSDKSGEWECSNCGTQFNTDKNGIIK